ncbi:hypothetical protein DFH09DRAFT_275412 [Mycena vulgaris]|nr:hypothetical protein DFH09DRAFT_275412 [Mycena vulgaris]
MHWNEFSAWLTIDGNVAPEFDVETSEDQKTVTCWIASELGKTFAVHWKNSSYYHDTIGRVKMDGTPCGGSLIRKQFLPKAIEHGGVFEGTSVKPFMFSSLALTDDDTFLGGSSSHQELGLISLTIHPIRIKQRNVPARPSSSLAEIKVHERVKKAVTQQITLAKPKKLAYPSVFVTSQRTGPDLVQFCFKYRPMAILQANGIAPLPVRPEQKASVEPPRAPPPNLAEPAAKTRPARENLNAREFKTVKTEKKPRIKREFEPGSVIDLTQPTKKAKLKPRQPFISGEIIDLT